LECYLDPPAPEIRLEEITVPALVIHSSDDAIVPVAVGESVASRLPNATLVKLDNGGHVPSVTQPAQVVEAIQTHFGT
jgi:pimeloyl-ACP methyl ester carboxylesterase